MKRIQGTLLFSLLLLTSFAMWGCPSKTNVKNGQSTVKAGGKVVAKAGGCIRGRVVSDEDKGFAGVIVETTPSTNFVVTDSDGYFTICKKRQRGAEGQGSQMVNVPKGDYKLVVKKEGFHHRPVTFAYSGKEQNLGNIRVVEKTRPLPSVSQTKTEEGKRTSGVGGKQPKSE